MEPQATSPMSGDMVKKAAGNEEVGRIGMGPNSGPHAAHFSSRQKVNGTNNEWVHQDVNNKEDRFHRKLYYAYAYAHKMVLKCSTLCSLCSL